MDAHLNRQCGTQRQLKEALYNEAANLFDEKELWEESIGILKELTFQYEKNYEYEKLPGLLVSFFLYQYIQSIILTFQNYFNFRLFFEIFSYFRF